MLLLHLVIWCASLWAARQNSDLVAIQYSLDPAFSIAPEPLAQVLISHLVRMDRTSVRAVSFEVSVENRRWFCERQLVDGEQCLREGEKCRVETWIVVCMTDTVQLMFRQESKSTRVEVAEGGYCEYRLRACNLTLIGTRARNTY